MSISYTNIYNYKVVELGYEPNEDEQNCLDKNPMAKILKGNETSTHRFFSYHLVKN